VYAIYIGALLAQLSLELLPVLTLRVEQENEEERLWHKPYKIKWAIRVNKELFKVDSYPNNKFNVK
jgi:hypothetical protein